jgi:DNA-binding NtrC family response regulator
MQMALKALIVADRHVMRLRIMKGLHQAGLAEFDFIEAEDLCQALDRIRTGAIDLAFVATDLTGLKDSVPADELRKINPGLPLVLVVGEKPGSTGDTVCIWPPFDPEDLHRQLGPVIERARASQPSLEGRSVFARLFG